MQKVNWLSAIALMLVGGAAVHAQEAASATLTLAGTDTSSSPAVYTYNLTLHDTGTTTAGTFWFSWIPGQDYMQAIPTSIVNPAGWQSVITGGSAGDGYAIQWKASLAAADVSSGGSLSGFSFKSTDTLAYLQGNSTFFPTTPVGTSFIYSGAPFSDSGFRFVTNAVPEPTVLSGLGFAIVGLRRRRQV